MSATAEKQSAGAAWDDWLQQFRDAEQALSQARREVISRESEALDAEYGSAGAWTVAKNVAAQVRDFGLHAEIQPIRQPEKYPEQYQQAVRARRALAEHLERKMQVNRSYPGKVQEFRALQDNLAEAEHRHKAATEALEQARTDLADAEDALVELAGNRPPANDAALAEIQAEIDSRQAQVDKIQAAVDKARADLEQRRERLDGKPAQELADMEAQAALEQPDAKGKAALARARKSAAEARQAVAHSETLLQGLEPRLAAAVERLEEMRALHTEVSLRRYKEDLRAAEQAVLDTLQGEPLRKLVSRVNQVRAEINALPGREDQHSPVAVFRVQLPDLYGVDVPDQVVEITGSSEPPERPILA